MNLPWKDAVVLGKSWQWRHDKLWHLCASPLSTAAPVAGIQSGFVTYIYADQNRSRSVRAAISELLNGINKDGIALNIGAGKTRYPGVVNLEISDGANVDIIGHGSELPFRTATVDLVLMQEVLEHVPDFLDLVNEVKRVLKPGGLFYCQVPFQIGFHPGPKDYWRFTRQGIQQLFSGPEWSMQRLAISLGHGSGFYRIAVEFSAVTASCVWRQAYRPAKAIAALLLYPFKWFDLITERSAEMDRIPGGYFCIVKKNASQEVD